MNEWTTATTRTFCFHFLFISSGDLHRISSIPNPYPLLDEVAGYLVEFLVASGARLDMNHIIRGVAVVGTARCVFLQSRRVA